jgi:hypothetical protein
MSQKSVLPQTSGDRAFGLPIIPASVRFLSMDLKRPFDVRFHPDAAERFNEIAQGIISRVGSFGPTVTPPQRPSMIHPVAQISPEDIVGQITFQQSSVNIFGEEMGRYWSSNGMRVGWEGAEFEEIRELARRFEKVDQLKGRVSHEFLMDEIYGWLRGTLERKRGDTLADYIAECCSGAIKDHEIWIPIYRTYSEEVMVIGNVEFPTISKEMLDRWYGRPSKGSIKDPVATHAINKERSLLQGSIAARIKVTAEPKRATAAAHVMASEAIALLRLLSPVNWTCKTVSHSLPVGRENTMQAVELFVEADAVTSVSKRSIEQGPAGWSVDQERKALPGLLESLHKLASTRDEAEFRSDLYGALQLYSRNSVATEVSHKVVFVVAAIESLLLRNSNEPIQKNLGERMAFLIGNTRESRREVIKSVDDFYCVRSALIHHGLEVTAKDATVIDKFFVNVWAVFVELLAHLDHFRTKEELLIALENRKLD